MLARPLVLSSLLFAAAAVAQTEPAAPPQPPAHPASTLGLGDSAWQSRPSHSDLRSTRLPEP